MAIACFGFFTFGPLPRILSSPSLNSCITRSTVSFWGFDCFAMGASLVAGCCLRAAVQRAVQALDEGFKEFVAGRCGTGRSSVRAPVSASLQLADLGAVGHFARHFAGARVLNSARD